MQQPFQTIGLGMWKQHEAQHELPQGPAPQLLQFCIQQQPLLNIADFMDEDNEVIIKSMTSLLEPVILIVLGAIVGFVAISMFMPLFDLTAAAQG